MTFLLSGVSGPRTDRPEGDFVEQYFNQFHWAQEDISANPPQTVVFGRKWKKENQDL